MRRMEVQNQYMLFLFLFSLYISICFKTSLVRANFTLNSHNRRHDTYVLPSSCQDGSWTVLNVSNEYMLGMIPFCLTFFVRYKLILDKFPDSQVKAEKIKSRAQEKYANKSAVAGRIAEEKRASAAAKLNDRAARTSDRTDYIRRTGHLPSSFFSFKLPSLCSWGPLLQSVSWCF